MPDVGGRRERLWLGMPRCPLNVPGFIALSSTTTPQHRRALDFCLLHSRGLPLHGHGSSRGLRSVSADAAVDQVKDGSNIHISDPVATVPHLR